MDLIIIKKIVTALFYPANIIFIAALLALFFKLQKAPKLSFLFRFVLVACFILSTNSLSAYWLVNTLEKQHPPQLIADIKKHDAIIVLGGGLRTPVPPAKHIQLGAAADRYWYAVQLYRAGRAKQILLSGGNTVEQIGVRAEAVYAKDLLERWGVPSKDILVEPNSRTTYENQQYVADIIDDNNIKSALLVTSAIHMPRAYQLFEKLPLTVTPASTDSLSSKVNSIAVLNWIPSASAMQLTTQALHEYYAIWYGRLKALISSS